MVTPLALNLNLLSHKEKIKIYGLWPFFSAKMAMQNIYLAIKI